MNAPYPVIEITETSSTNDYIRQLNGKEPLAEGTTVSAGFQLSGRGQVGNSWESEAGKNLLFSTLLYPTGIKITEQFILSQLVAVSIQEALENYLAPITIKWPNDIYYGDKKLAGILIENDLCAAEISLSIIGLGVNVNQSRFYSDAPNPVSLLQLLGIEIDKRLLLTDYLTRLAANYSLLKNGEVNELRKCYHAALFRREGFHPFRDNAGLFSAQIEEIDTSGYLHLVTESGECRKYFFKEVSFVIH